MSPGSASGAFSQLDVSRTASAGFPGRAPEPLDSLMIELLTLSLRESPASLQRKLISATCIPSLIPPVTTHQSTLLQMLFHPSVHLQLHHSLTSERDPEILELLQSKNTRTQLCGFQEYLLFAILK